MRLKARFSNAGSSGPCSRKRTGTLQVGLPGFSRSSAQNLSWPIDVGRTKTSDGSGSAAGGVNGSEFSNSYSRLGLQAFLSPLRGSAFLHFSTQGLRPGFILSPLRGSRHYWSEHQWWLGPAITSRVLSLAPAKRFSRDSDLSRPPQLRALLWRERRSSQSATARPRSCGA